MTSRGPSHVHPSLLIGSRRRSVFAHRGGSALRPENTLVAFDHGLALGADGLELDVRFARDGQVVVHHDARLERTTDAQGLVSSLDADELARVDAGYRFGAESGYPWRGRGVHVPRLRDVLERYPDAALILELKPDGGSPVALAQAAVAEVVEARALDRVCFGSFALGAVRGARAAGPGVMTSAAREEVQWALYRSWIGWPAVRPSYQAFQVPEHSGRTRVVSRRFVSWAHRAGAAVQVWTVDEPDEMRRLLAWGVDAIITDRPDLGVPVVRAWASSGETPGQDQ